jgi:hypothetical protein
MRKGFNRQRPKSGPGRLLGIIPILVLMLSLAWIWKADMVKEYYSTMKDFEAREKTLMTENAHLKGELTELKSLTNVNNVVTKRFGLTQNVSSRVFLQDPIKPAGRMSKFHLVDMQEITDWLERAVFKSGHVTAEEQKNMKTERK